MRFVINWIRGLLSSITSKKPDDSTESDEFKSPIFTSSEDRGEKDSDDVVKGKLKERENMYLVKENRIQQVKNNEKLGQEVHEMKVESNESKYKDYLQRLENETEKSSILKQISNNNETLISEKNAHKSNISEILKLSNLEEVGNSNISEGRSVDRKPKVENLSERLEVDIQAKQSQSESSESSFCEQPMERKITIVCIPEHSKEILESSQKILEKFEKIFSDRLFSPFVLKDLDSICELTDESQDYILIASMLDGRNLDCIPILGKWKLASSAYVAVFNTSTEIDLSRIKSLCKKCVIVQHKVLNPLLFSQKQLKLLLE